MVAAKAEFSISSRLWLLVLVIPVVAFTHAQGPSYLAPMDAEGRSAREVASPAAAQAPPEKCTPPRVGLPQV